MSKHGGKREGAGRKTKADEEKANALFNKALSVIYKKKGDEANQIAFIKTLLESQRGQIFVAEHLFGKPKEFKEVEITDHTIKIGIVE